MFNWIKAVLYMPSGEDVLRKQLRDAERTRAEHAALREFYAANEKMLESRIKRIRRELKAREQSA
jgi:hypothetical protein